MLPTATLTPDLQPKLPVRLLGLSCFYGWQRYLCQQNIAMLCIQMQQSALTPISQWEDLCSWAAKWNLLRRVFFLFDPFFRSGVFCCADPFSSCLLIFALLSYALIFPPDLTFNTTQHLYLSGLWPAISMPSASLFLSRPSQGMQIRYEQRPRKSPCSNGWASVTKRDQKCQKFSAKMSGNDDTINSTVKADVSGCT